MVVVVAIRRANVADADDIARVNLLGWQVGYAGQLPEEYLRGLSLPTRQQRWRTRLATEERQDQVLVAVDSDEVIGFASTGPSRDHEADKETGELYALYVHPHHWSRGIGAALNDGAVAALQQAGHSEAIVWVLRSNSRAQRFYERNGWNYDGTSKTDKTSDGLELPEIRFHRTLDSSASSSSSHQQSGT